MNIKEITGGCQEGLVKAGEAIKDAALWAGRMIKTGFTKFAEAITKLWNISSPILKEVAIKTLTFLRSAPGFAMLGGLLGTALGVTAETLSEDKKYLAVILRIAAAVAFVGMGIAIGVGIVTGFNAPLV